MQKQFLEAISSFSLNSFKRAKGYLAIDIMCDNVINLSFREDNL